MLLRQRSHGHGDGEVRLVTPPRRVTGSAGRWLTCLRVWSRPTVGVFVVLIGKRVQPTNGRLYGLRFGTLPVQPTNGRRYRLRFGTLPVQPTNGRRY